MEKKEIHSIMGGQRGAAMIVVNVERSRWQKIYHLDISLLKP
jgi:hypothetical protein